MKKVFGSHSEVAHVWAQQNQNEGRASRMFFEGVSIYSYGYHFEIARFVTPEIVLFNCARYSLSTGKHQSRAYSAVRYKTVFTVPTMDNHDENAVYLVKQVKDKIERLKRARKGIVYRMEFITKGILTAHSYLSAFRRKINLETRKVIRGLDAYQAKQLPREFLDAKINKEREADKLLQVKQEEQRRIEALEEVERLEKWKTGEYDGYLRNVPIALRIKNNVVQTTQGANVPLIAARRFWHMLERKENVIGMRLGHYTVDSLDGFTLVVGCHIIPLKEVYRIAKNLNWLSEITI